jgi:chromosome segregation ATPase
MADADNKLLFEILKKIQNEVTGTNLRMDKIETHLGNLERRQTASTHFEQSVLAHLAGIHESLDELRSDMRAVRGEMRDVHHRIERVEAR